MNHLTIQKLNDWNSPWGFSRGIPSLFDEIFVPEAGLPSRQAAGYELEENEEHYLLTLETPGIPKEGLKIEVAGQHLTIEGERARAGKLNPRQFSWSFKLPEGVDASRIEADYRDGVLWLAIPKAEANKPRQITISSSPGFLGKLLGQHEKERGENPSGKNEVA